MDGRTSKRSLPLFICH